jgi:hypothetical protein
MKLPERRNLEIAREFERTFDGQHRQSSISYQKTLWKCAELYHPGHENLSQVEKIQMSQRYFLEHPCYQVL